MIICKCKPFVYVVLLKIHKPVLLNIRPNSCKFKEKEKYWKLLWLYTNTQIQRDDDDVDDDDDDNDDDDDVAVDDDGEEQINS